MKKLFSTIFLLLIALCLFAQAPQKMNYQAVVRNANNSLVANQSVSARISILRGSATGAFVYSETHTVTTNANGLMTIEIGSGNATIGYFAQIDWANGPYFIQSEIDPEGGINYSVTSTQQLLSVPYALYAGSAANGFSGDYNDLSNRPQIPQVPANVSAFNNDAGYITNAQASTLVENYNQNAGYITAADVPAQVNADWNATEGAAQILNKPELFDGDYNSLSNRPQIPQVPANVSAFNNDAGYITNAQASTLVENYNQNAGYITAADVPAQVNADWNATEGAAQILNKPELFDGDYNSLSNRPQIPQVPANVSAFNNDAGYITNAQASTLVENYNQNAGYITAADVPTNVSAFNNDANYITAADVPAQVNADWNATEGAAQILNKPELFDGDYNSLSNRPQIPQVPANVSAFNNDAGYITNAQASTLVDNYNQNAGYITAADVPTNVSAFNNDANYITAADVPAQVNADWNATEGAAQILNKPELFDGDYNSLSNRPQIPQVPANVSAFNNDAGYITNADVPTNVSAFANDAGYLTQATVQAAANIPTNVSAFNNDAGYVTTADVPINVSELLNDADYVTSMDMPTNLSDFENDVYFVSNADCPTVDLCDLNSTLNTLQNTVSNMQNLFTARLDSMQNTIDEQQSIISAQDSLINSLSNQMNSSFVCGSSVVRDHEGNVYNTVQMGDQCWTKENMRCTTSPSTGTTILEFPAGEGSFVGKKAFYPNDDPNVVDNGYGLLYNWNAAVDTFNTDFSETASDLDDANANGANFIGNRRGICPQGWHIPTSEEWSNMCDFVSGQSEFLCEGISSSIAKALSAEEGWNYSASLCSVGNSSEDNNATGFSLLPAGYHYFEGFLLYGNYADFWTANQAGYSVAEDRYVLTNNNNVRVSYSSKDLALSIRCLRDNGIGGASSANESGSVVEEGESSDSGCCLELGASMERLQNRMDSLQNTIAAQDSVIDALNNQVNPAFACGTHAVKDHQGNVYHTVQIGNQCWTKENMRCTTSPSTNTYLVMSYSNDSYSGKRAYYYDDDPSSANNDYGLLYNWNAAMDTFNVTYSSDELSTNTNTTGSYRFNLIGNRRGICPQGWHIPKDAEWSTMTDAVSGESGNVCGSDNENIAKALASKNGWESHFGACTVGREPGNNDAVGFSGLPAGYIRTTCQNLGEYTYYWSSSELNGAIVYCRSLKFDAANVPNGGRFKNSGISVRCLRDNGVSGAMADNEGVFENSTAEVLNNRIDSLMQVLSAQDSVLNALNEYFTPFMCGTSTIKDHEGNVYNTVKIGNQCWTKENMRCKTSPTTHVNFLENPAAGDSYSGKKAYYYNDDESAFTNQYGLLYNWNAAVDTFNVAFSETSVSSNYNNAVNVKFSGFRRGICPKGWHVPSYDEWQLLLNTMACEPAFRCSDNVTYLAKSLAAMADWASDPADCAIGEDLGNNDDTGFSLYPAGFYAGNYEDLGYSASIWTVTQGSDMDYAYYANFRYNDADVGFYDDSKSLGQTVRCLRDAGIAETSPSDASTAMEEQLNQLQNSMELMRFCGDTKVQDVDGNSYNIVKIGNQCWTKENLNTKRYADGTLIPEGNSASTTSPYWYYPNGSDANEEKYGLLYNWMAVMRGSSSSNTNPSNVQGICPDGWHVPSKSEWLQLMAYVMSHDEFICDGNSDNIAKALAAANGWNTSLEECSVGFRMIDNDATGFSALPAGYCYTASYNNSVGSYAKFWCTTQNSFTNARCFSLDFEDGDMMSTDVPTYEGYSVRCLRNMDGFVCGTSTISDCEGNRYNTVQIGEQCWTRENMRATKYSDGTSISYGTAESTTTPYYCYPNNDALIVQDYGLLYNWKAAMRNASSSTSAPSGVQGICPTGWHVPSVQEWETLTNFVRADSRYLCGSYSNTYAKALASKTGWYNSNEFCAVGNDSESNNLTGFSAFPAGDVASVPCAFGTSAMFWTTNVGGAGYAYAHVMQYNYSYCETGISSQDRERSVRCIRD